MKILKITLQNSPDSKAMVWTGDNEDEMGKFVSLFGDKTEELQPNFNGPPDRGDMVVCVGGKCWIEDRSEFDRKYFISSEVEV